MPKAAPRGAPKRRGDRRPKPIMPYFFQISYILPVFGDFLPYLHFKNQFLTPSPSVATRIAEKIEPAAAVMAINIGFIQLFLTITGNQTGQ